MAKSFQATVSTYSRFAALEQDSDEEDTPKNTDKQQKKSNAEKNAKKKARKKKKAAENSAATNELRNLAFSTSISAKAIQNIHQQRHQLSKDDINTTTKTTTTHATEKNPVESNDPSWEDWKNKDEEFVTDQFQKDLEIALRISESEKNKAQKNLEMNSRKRNTKKSSTMSLEEFKKLSVSKDIQDTQMINTQSIRNGYCPEDLDPNHYRFETPLEESPNLSHTNASTTTDKKKRKKKKAADKTALSDVLSKLHNEEKVDQHSKPSSNTIDVASFASWQDSMEKKDREIQQLKELTDSLKEELIQVKKRNKQFCFILAQGEMKDKAEILLQVDQLTNVKNELSAELSETVSSLEQERTKVSNLKQELLKYQHSRMKSKSISEEK